MDYKKLELYFKLLLANCKVCVRISTVTPGDRKHSGGACGRDYFKSVFYRQALVADFIVAIGNHWTIYLLSVSSYCGAVHAEQHVWAKPASISMPDNFSLLHKGLMQSVQNGACLLVPQAPSRQGVGGWSHALEETNRFQWLPDVQERALVDTGVWLE